ARRAPAAPGQDAAPGRETAAPASREPAAPAQTAAVLVISDGVSDDAPLGGVDAAVRRFNAAGGRATLAVAAPAKAEEKLRAIARDNRAVIVVTGGAADPVAKVARETPETRFTLVGGQAEGDNVRSIRFRDAETDWLAGWLAGKAVGDGDVGLVGLQGDPAARESLCAVAQGLAAATPGARLLPDLAAPEADGALAARAGARLTARQIDRGAQVVLTAPGAVGAGAMDAVHDAGALGAPRDARFLTLFPRNVLATRTRNYEGVTFDALRASGDAWRPGATSVGLADGAVDIALNDGAVADAPALREALAAGRRAIASGAVSGVGFGPDGTCSVRRTPPQYPPPARAGGPLSQRPDGAGR
ncbi:BMP family protein, partial [Camelimonas abortus]